MRGSLPEIVRRARAYVQPPGLRRTSLASIATAPRSWCIEKAGSIVQDVHQSARSKVKSEVALMLTFSAGLVDIVGYIAVYHWFVAHMTGDTVHLGNQMVMGRWSDAEKMGHDHRSCFRNRRS
jgi:hypothetical protein